MFQPNIVLITERLVLLSSKFSFTMPAKETESVLTEDQKATLIPHINAFRQGDRTERAQIVRKLAKPMSAVDDPPLVQSKYFKVIELH